MTDATSRVKAWDGLRGAACIFVLGFHCGLVPGGAIGVDLFFVLSGFLITRSLIKESEQFDRVSLKHFYVRRIVRLMPALLVFLTIATCIGFLMGPGYLFGSSEWGAPLAVLFFAANWAAVASGEALGVLQPTWSLAIEEQFYLLIAPLLAFLLAQPKRARWIPWTLGLLAILSLAVRLSLWSQSGGVYQESSAFYRQYVGLDARAYALLLGALAALPQSQGLCDWISHRRTLLGGLAIVALLIASQRHDFYHETGIGLIAPLSAAILIVVLSDSGPMKQFFELSPLLWLGKMSYSLYLWHIAAFAIVDPVSTMDPYGHPPHLGSLVGMLGLALTLGWFSYRFVEEPAMNRRQVFLDWLERRGSVVQDYRQPSAQ